MSNTDNNEAIIATEATDTVTENGLASGEKVNSASVNHIPKKEFWWYTIAGLGQGMIYATMSSYISDFYLNVMGLTPIFVLLLMLLARVWDAINDPMMGMIVDRCNPRRGKMKTYILATPIPVAILTALMFYVPGFADITLSSYSATKAMVYASIVYVLWGMIYTMSDVPFWSLPNMMTPNPKERANLISIGRTLNGIGSAMPMVLSMVLGPLLVVFGLSGTQLERSRYLTIALTAAILGNIIFANSYRHVNERVMLPQAPKRKKGEPSALKLIFTCKPLMLVVLMGILSSGRYMLQAAAIHVARYTFYVGASLEGLVGAELESALQANISKVQLIFSVATAAGMFGAMLFMPKLFKKFSYKQIIISTCLIGFVSGLIMFLIGYDNLYVLIPFLVIASIPLGAINVVSYAMICDSLDYLELKSGRRDNGLGSACQSFVNKFGNAIATSFIIIMYIIVGIKVDNMAANKLTINPLEQSNEVRQGMFSLVTIIPAACLLLCTIPIFFYDIVGKKKEEIVNALAKQREEQGVVIG